MINLLEAVTLVLCFVVFLPLAAGAVDRVDEQFREQIQPILEMHCVECHDNSTKKGGLVLDDFQRDPIRLRDGTLWLTVLKNIRANIMPPVGHSALTDEERRLLEGWIKNGPFSIQPTNVNPGRVTVHRLNRAEYRNTIRDLMGVDYDTQVEFPPDDSGHGFDNMADVLTLSPLLMEKYLVAAKAIVSQVVPTVPRVVAETKIDGPCFQRLFPDERGKKDDGSLSLSYYKPALVTSSFHAEQPGRYKLTLDLTACETAGLTSDYNKCRVGFKVDGRELFQQDFSRQENVPFIHEIDLDWSSGEHKLAFTVEPLTPNERQLRYLEIRINSVVVQGPLEQQFWVRPANYHRFFPTDVPEGSSERRLYARNLLHAFAKKAFRRPVDDLTVDRLADLAEHEYSMEGGTFEAGVAHAMTAVLASPRFLFREEGSEDSSSDRYPLIDEYALASRLSYFLWSSMPDNELFQLAEEHALRKNLPAQVQRMLRDPRSEEFLRNFVGQWLQARGIETVPINAFAVIDRDEPSEPDVGENRVRMHELNRRFSDALTDEEKKERNEVRATYFKSFRRFRKHALDDELRTAMRRETEMVVARIIHEDRSLRELLVSDYTFLNERLANHYGIEGVEGKEMRFVALPADSPRGGILTQGSVLVMTSNPDRTSPVKRGFFILDNILGIPPLPQPPNVPPLEATAKEFEGRILTLRETLELHRNMTACRSCHDRMDPMGLALENFNALGQWRDRDNGGLVDSTGRLVTGESFTNIQELKRILVDNHHRELFCCLSEKMLTYALGRGLDFRDTETIDNLVDRIETENGRASALLYGIVESPQFQRRQRSTVEKNPNRIDQSTAGSGHRQ